MSLEGTAGGVAASLLFAGVALVLGQVDARGAIIATAAAFVATTLESWLGASIQAWACYLTLVPVYPCHLSLSTSHLSLLHTSPVPPPYQRLTLPPHRSPYTPPYTTTLRGIT